MWTPPKEIYQHAYQNGYAVGTFNISNLETLRAIIAAAEVKRSPVVVATSKGEGDFIDYRIAAMMVKELAAKSTVPIGIHLDHGQSFEEVKGAIEAGYLSVHIDASALSLEENIKITKQVVEYAAQHGVNVEGEVGHVGGSSSQHDTDEVSNIIGQEGLTNPEEAWHYAQETGIDQLAIAIGNVHGVYAGEPHIDQQLLREINQKVGLPLVLHGGSGIPAVQVQESLRQGIAKVNVNTELRMAYAHTLRETLNANPKLVTPYKNIQSGHDSYPTSSGG